MEKLKLNETPVRTSRNFLINNIKLENVVIPEKLEMFQNVMVTGTESFNKDINKQHLNYGLSEELEENVFYKANSQIAINVKENDNIKVTYDFDDDNLQLVNQIDICATGNANIIIEYKSSTNKECFHNGVIKVFAKENAKLNITVINLLNSNSEHFEAMENILEDNSDLNYTIIDIGGKNSIQNYYSNIIGKSAKNDLKTIYLGSENQIKDINYIAELRGQKSFVDIDVQGALKENAKKNFKGTIDFKKGCKKAKGNENEFCMLLSEKAKSLALPMLLCTEDDVEGNHSTASGKVDKEQLFYIMTRGLSYKEAVKLIVRANFNKTIERILDEEVKQNIIKEIDERLD
ncbi:MAG: SufD family Fe-S cluster assembly protein [Clostridia bacterium]|jgi:Fe-S cluster assembly protein SufD|nr:SufD family Fe-S cluster assembly protein [Clostridia bacterium]